MNDRIASPSLPSEITSEPAFAKQARAYTDCYRWWLSDEDRRRWLDARVPLLTSLQAGWPGSGLLASAVLENETSSLVVFHRVQSLETRAMPSGRRAGRIFFLFAEEGAVHAVEVIG